MTIDQFIDEQPQPISALTRRIYDYLRREYPQLEPDLKLGFKAIYFKQDKVICSLNPYRDYVSLHFMRGINLDDPGKVLEGSGKKLRHLKFSSLEAFENLRPKTQGFLNQSLEGVEE